MEIAGTSKIPESTRPFTHVIVFSKAFSCIERSVAMVVNDYIAFSFLLLCTSQRPCGLLIHMFSYKSSFIIQSNNKNVDELQTSLMYFDSWYSEHQ